MTGSIEKRGKNSYSLVVFKGYDLDGKAIRHQKTVHCKNKSEARTELAKYIAQVENGFVVDGTVPTFKEFVEMLRLIKLLNMLMARFLKKVLKLNIVKG